MAHEFSIFFGGAIFPDPWIGFVGKNDLPNLEFPVHILPSTNAMIRFFSNENLEIQLKSPKKTIIQMKTFLAISNFVFQFPVFDRSLWVQPRGRLNADIPGR